MAEVALREGIAPDGALHYEGKNGKIIDAGKEWWPQTEAMVGFVNAFQLSRDAKFVEAARRAWQFADRQLVDRVYGEWFWRILPDGRMDQKMPKVSEWKGPYHVLRACLETTRRLTVLASRANLPSAIK
jgi:mannobiose 2-epimerase